MNVFGDLPFLTGGSGLAKALAAHHAQHVSLGRSFQTYKNLVPRSAGGGLILAGSCSVATQQQVAAFIADGGIALKIEPEKLLRGEQTQEDILKFIRAHDREDVLIYSSDTRENVRKSQDAGKENVSALLEETMAYVASESEKHGTERIIVAGGETSGAVTKALGYSSYLIGESVAPGVPLMAPIANKRVRVILKSGNFGPPDFFGQALRIMKEDMAEAGEMPLWR